jgi:lipopolysaccharide export LptBFGC system permease protein LptF
MNTKDSMTLLYGNKNLKKENKPVIEKDKEYLDIPFNLKDIIKSKNGFWDNDKKKWFIYKDNKNKEEIYNIIEKQQKIKKIYIEVPYKLKDIIKSKNALWDKNKKKWFIYEDNENKKEIKKLIFDYNIKTQKVYLDIPYELKDEAKNDGCRFCKNEIKWYITQENNNYNYYMTYAI